MIDYNPIPPKRSIVVNVKYGEPKRGTPLPYPVELEACYEHIRQYCALIAARAGTIEHAGQCCAVTWDGCPWCGE